MVTLADNYKSALSKLRLFFREHKYLPSTREISDLLGFGENSKTQAIRILQSLASTGYLDQTETGRYIPGENFFSYPIYRSVQAGSMTAAEADDAELVNLEKMIIPDPDHSFMVTVRGNSMQDAGILDGDVVVIKNTDKARPGEIVIAELNGEFTVKYFQLTDEGTPYLHPANTKYSDIYFNSENDVRLVGRVTGVIRQLR